MGWWWGWPIVGVLWGHLARAWCTLPSSFNSLPHSRKYGAVDYLMATASSTVCHETDHIYLDLLFLAISYKIIILISGHESWHYVLYIHTWNFWSQIYGVEWTLEWTADGDACSVILPSYFHISTQAEFTHCCQSLQHRMVSSSPWVHHNSPAFIVNTLSTSSYHQFRPQHMIPLNLNHTGTNYYLQYTWVLSAWRVSRVQPGEV